LGSFVRDEAGSRGCFGSDQRLHFDLGTSSCPRLLPPRYRSIRSSGHRHAHDATGRLHSPRLSSSRALPLPTRLFSFSGASAYRNSWAPVRTTKTSPSIAMQRIGQCSSRTWSKVSLAQKTALSRCPPFFDRGRGGGGGISLDIGEADAPIPLPNVSSNVLKKVRSAPLCLLSNAGVGWVG
jgi:hypothetical protein